MHWNLKGNHVFNHNRTSRLERFEGTGGQIQQVGGRRRSLQPLEPQAAAGGGKCSAREGRPTRP